MADALTIVSSVGLSGLLLWLTKSWISERLKGAIRDEYDQKLETHKAQLKCVYDKEIEQLKAQLQIAAAEQSIRLSRVFERTAETIATTYAKLLAFNTAALNYTQLMEPSDDPKRLELREIVQDKAADFVEFYLPSQIYIPKTTRVKIAIFYNHLDHLTRRFAQSLLLDAKNENVDEWAKTYNKLHDQIPELLTSLEEDFQRILGLEERKLGSGK